MPTVVLVYVSAELREIHLVLLQKETFHLKQRLWSMKKAVVVITII